MNEDYALVWVQDNTQLAFLLLNKLQGEMEILERANKRLERELNGTRNILEVKEYELKSANLQLANAREKVNQMIREVAR